MAHKPTEADLLRAQLADQTALVAQLLAAQRVQDHTPSDDEALARKLQSDWSSDHMPHHFPEGDHEAIDVDELYAQQLQREEDGSSSVLGFGATDSAADIQLASMMQRMEMERGTELETGNGGAVAEEGMILRDPVWGSLQVAEGESPKPLQILLFALCPCFAGDVCIRRAGVCGYICPLECAPAKVIVLHRLAWTMSAWLGLVQVLSHHLQTKHTLQMFGSITFSVLFPRFYRVFFRVYLDVKHPRTN